MRIFPAILAATMLTACSSGHDTPAPAAAGSAIAIVNGDFEQPGNADGIPGWMMMQHVGPLSYDMVVESAGAYAGHGAFRMTRTQEQVYGSLVQNVYFPKPLGGEVELSAMMKTKDVGAQGWKLMLVIAENPQYSQALVGTTDWQRVTVRAKLPPNSDTIRIGAMLLDAGSGWLDDVQLRTIAQ